MPKKQPSRTGAGPKKATRKPAAKTVVKPGRCPYKNPGQNEECGSTAKEPYYATKSRAIAGTIDGQPYTQITWKRTRCKKCGRSRVDMFYENP